MTSLERAEIRRLPKKYRPLGAWGYFWYTVLFSIPVIGLIALIACSASSKNVVRRGFARSFWCGIIIGLIFLAITVGVGAILVATDIIPLETLTNFLDAMKEAFSKLTVN